MGVTHLVIISVFFYAMAQILAPFSYSTPVGVETYAFVAVMLLSLLGGSVLYEARGANRAAWPAWGYSAFAVQRATLIFCIISLLGVGLRFIDLFVFRSEQFSGGQEARLLQLKLAAGSSGTGAGGFSAISALLASMSLFGLVFFRHFRSLLSGRMNLTLLFLGVFPAIEALVSRGGVFALGYVLIFAWFTLGDDSDLRRKAGGIISWPVLGLIGAGFVLGGGYLFRQRIELMFGSVGAYQMAAAGSSLLRFPDWILELSRSEAMGLIVFPIVWIMDYTLQGFVELNYILANFHESLHSHGAFQFDVLLRGFAILTGRVHESVEYIHPRPGKYSTMLSDVYMDFGVLGGAVQMFILGFLTAATRSGRLNGNPFGLVFGPLLKTMLMVGFLSNVFPGSRFYSVIIGFAVAALIFFCRTGRPPATLSPGVAEGGAMIIGGRALSCLIAFLAPAPIQRFLLNMLGHSVGRGAYIGFSLIYADKIHLQDGATIGHFNIVICRRILMRRGAFMRSFNIVRGHFSLCFRDRASAGKWNRFVKARGENTVSNIVLKRGSAVALGHYLNADDSIVLGENSILAGMHTQIWTHGFVHMSDRRTRVKVVGPVRIGDNVYVGSGCIINPNVVIGDDITIATGASVAKDLHAPGLYAPQPLRRLARTPEERLGAYELVSSPGAGGNPVYRRKSAGP